MIYCDAIMLMLRFNGCADARSDEEIKTEETELFTKYYNEWKGRGNNDKSFSSIPRFYYKVSFHHMQFKPSNKHDNYCECKYVQSETCRNFKCFIVHRVSSVMNPTQVIMMLLYSFQLKMRYYFKSCGRNPELSSSRGRVENCWIMRNYR